MKSLLIAACRTDPELLVELNILFISAEIDIISRVVTIGRRTQFQVFFRQFLRGMKRVEVYRGRVRGEAHLRSSLFTVKVLGTIRERGTAPKQHSNYP